MDVAHLLSSGEPEVKIGSEFALFLSGESEPNLAAAPFDGLDVIDMWPVSTGVVRSPSGDISVDELLSNCGHI